MKHYKNIAVNDFSNVPHFEPQTPTYISITYGFFRYLFVDPFPKVLYGFFRSDLAEQIAISVHKKFGNKKVPNQDGVNHQWHQPGGVHNQCQGAGLDVRGHEGFFVAEPMDEILESVSQYNGQGADSVCASRNGIDRELECFRGLQNGELQTPVDKGRVKNRRYHGSRHCDGHRVKADGNSCLLGIQGDQRHLNGAPDS
mmetsp:Transcript_13542/g.18881  ORF Transcript_13542/g.18881 Transcript_13542/m.18881 type:complete len:199 (-) Transcript_13542:215-811(-)